jgi:predicted anti-sigma-YlaC factor YlaD
MDRDLTCREFVDFLDDYLARSLAGEALASFEKHLSDCPPCVAYLQTYEQSIRMGRAALKGSDERVPEAVPEDLVQAILAARRRD